MSEDEWSFFESYRNALPKLYDNPRLREVFLVKVMDDGKPYSPAEIVKDFIAEGEGGKRINTYIEALRASVILKMLQAN